MKSTENPYINRYRLESPVFHPEARNVYMPYIQPGDADSMRSYLRRLVGTEDHPGESYNNDMDRWEKAAIPALEDAIKGVDAKFDRLRQKILNMGNRPPAEMPDDLQEEKLKLEARLHIAREEVRFLEKEIVAKEKPGEIEPIRPRSQWGSGKLSDGILCEIGGITVQPDKSGLLRIADKRSDYDTMPVWQFKSRILRPMAWENSRRQKQEVEKARNDRRPAKPVPYPTAPVWNREIDEIEYPGYSEKTLEKIKELHSEN